MSVPNLKPQELRVCKIEARKSSFLRSVSRENEDYILCWLRFYDGVVFRDECIADRFVNEMFVI